jgi:hypothetical protein
VFREGNASVRSLRRSNLPALPDFAAATTETLMVCGTTGPVVPVKTLTPSTVHLEERLPRFPARHPPGSLPSAFFQKSETTDQTDNTDKKLVVPLISF